RSVQHFGSRHTRTPPIMTTGAGQAEPFSVANRSRPPGASWKSLNEMVQLMTRAIGVGVMLNVPVNDLGYATTPPANAPAESDVIPLGFVWALFRLVNEGAAQ